MWSIATKKLYVVAPVVFKLCTLIIAQNSSECNLYWAPSRVEGLGGGIFAGHQFVRGTTIGEYNCIAIMRKDFLHTQLTNYVYGSADPGAQS